MKRRVGRPPEGLNGTRVRDYPQVNVRVPPLVLRRFGQWAQRKGLSVGDALLTLMAKAK